MQIVLLIDKMLLQCENHSVAPQIEGSSNFHTAMSVSEDLLIFKILLIAFAQIKARNDWSTAVKIRHVLPKRK